MATTAVSAGGKQSIGDHRAAWTPRNVRESGRARVRSTGRGCEACLRCLSVCQRASVPTCASRPRRRVSPLLGHEVCRVTLVDHGINPIVSLAATRVLLECHRSTECQPNLSEDMNLDNRKYDPCQIASHTFYRAWHAPRGPDSSNVFHSIRCE